MRSSANPVAKISPAAGSSFHTSGRFRLRTEPAFSGEASSRRKAPT